MYEFYMEKIIELYSIILQPISNVYKAIAVNNCRKVLNIDHNSTFSSFYYKLLKDNKSNGVVYTPIEIANYMVKNTLSAKDIIENPYIKVIDPSCGCGNIVVPCFHHLKNIYLENLSCINEKNKLFLNEENLDEHIINNNLYGFDIDKVALKILAIDLFINSGCVSENFLNKDFLIEDINEKFNVFIGNPPYIGHKTIDKAYAEVLKKIYSKIYKDKGDISYCFFKKSLCCLEKNGKLSFITSRYFIESQSGYTLRKFLSQDSSIYKLVDFYGIRPFKNANIDPAIIFLKNKKNLDNPIKIIKPLFNKGKNKKEFLKSLFLNQGNNYKEFYLNRDKLKDERWILREEKELNIIHKIESKCSIRLEEISRSYQGIITGCDKAFIVDRSIIVKEKLEKDIIKPWIKSSFIGKNNLIYNNSFIIYSNLIKNENEYVNNLAHIEIYKDKLMNRRECKRGIRKWYELQWGRDQNIFDSKKIIFPYKSSNNRFALDKGSYFSADVYSLVLKENKEYTYEYLIYVLNSKLYEFYFKSFGKKLGEDLYEYYPNTVMKLLIPDVMYFEESNEKYLYDYFGLTEEEIIIVNNQHMDK